MKRRPKAFISYNHQDKQVATRVAESLRENGIDAWFDQWEILAGDSLVEKIFEEGLAGADVFLVILSKHSVASRWVQHELDSAMVKRIEGITRIIPLRVQDIEIPNSLRALRWIDLRDNFDEAMRELQMSIFQVYEKPPIGHPPDIVARQNKSVGGLSPLATSAGLFLLGTGKDEIGMEEVFSEVKIAEKLGLTSEEADDAIEELESLGLVRLRDYLGTSPYSHGDVEATYALFHHFRKEGLGYDPEEDLLIVANAIVAQKEVTGIQLSEITGLSPLRINRAVDFLDDYGTIRTLRTMGTAPYMFWQAYATGATRRFVADLAK